jgi:AcrR family transcriptional regulator
MGKRRAAAQKDGGAAYQQRRREILKVAADVFKEKGVQGASLNDVASALGTDRASLYYYVGSRQELFADVVREAVESNIELAEKILADDVDSPAKIRELAVGLMESYAANYPLLYVYIQEDLNRLGDPEKTTGAHAMNRRFDAAVIAIIQGGLDDGSLRSTASARTIAFGLIGMLNWTHRWFEPGHSSPDATEVGSTFADMVLQGLVTKRSRSRSS